MFFHFHCINFFCLSVLVLLSHIYGILDICKSCDNYHLNSQITKYSEILHFTHFLIIMEANQSALVGLLKMDRNLLKYHEI